MLAFKGFCNLQSITHTGYTGTDNEEIVLVYHILIVLNAAKVRISENNTKQKAFFFVFIVERKYFLAKRKDTKDKR